MSANGTPSPVVVPIPVIIPEKPLTEVIFPINSEVNVGRVTKTLGTAVAVYPNPEAVMVVVLIEPPVIVAVAVAVGFAVVPIPVVGIPIDTEVVAPIYPLPAFTMSSEEIVPAVDTIAVMAAETRVTLLSTILPLIGDDPEISPSSSKNTASSTNI